MTRRAIQNSFYLIFILFFICSCVTERKRLKICNGCPIKKERYDSIVEKVIEVPINIPGAPGPVVYLDNPCKELCDSLGRPRSNINIKTERNGQTLHIKSLGNGLNIVTERKDTALKVAVKQKEVYNKSYAESVKYIPCQNERTAFDGFCRWFFYIVSPIIALWLAYKLYFKRFNPP